MCTDLLTPAAADEFHVVTLLFTFFLGAMVGVMTRSGGTTALVDRAGRRATTRERGQLTGWGLGFLVFFDDYANMLLLGGTLRPLTDRLKISREKLAFLIDSTAAPVAGLAAVSTWVGVEIAAIGEGFESLGGGSVSYVYFLETIPYRFYPIYLLTFVFAVAWTGRDFGPMRRAERRAVERGELTRPGSSVAAADEVAVADTRPRLVNAALPLAVLVGLLAALMWVTGTEAVAKLAPDERPAAGWERTRTVIESADSFTALLIASLAASLTACLTAVLTGALPFREAAGAWVAGAGGMFPVSVVLILAWAGRAGLHDAGHRRVHRRRRGEFRDRTVAAGPVVRDGGGDRVQHRVELGHDGPAHPPVDPTGRRDWWDRPVKASARSPRTRGCWARSGRWLAGAIFGDHCSPISDTTVLSSAASGCDHLDHVAHADALRGVRGGDRVGAGLHPRGVRRAGLGVAAGGGGRDGAGGVWLGAFDQRRTRPVGIPDSAAGTMTPSGLIPLSHACNSPPSTSRSPGATSDSSRRSRGANTQGETLEIVRANLREAVGLVLEAHRTLAEEEFAGSEFVRELFRLSDAA